ncbi:ATP-binding protein [Candidatus Sumerlaeota bacterium]
MNHMPKGRSPFYPGQPVPVELFAGRQEQLDYILARGVRQVEAGKPVTMFVQGEYGIGKSSLAGYMQRVAEKQHGLHPIYASLGRAEKVEDVGAAVIEATVQSGGHDSNRGEKIKKWLAKYIDDLSLFGVTVRLDALKEDAPQISTNMLPFLSQALDKLKDTGVKGIFLVLDEINGISANARFAHFIKGLVDTNAMSRKPLPLLLMLCGVEERRRDMIQKHEPVGRVFDVVEIGPMPDAEIKDFFRRAFASERMAVDKGALRVLAQYSAGFPKIMHILGEAAYFADRDGTVDGFDAVDALYQAVDEVGKRYVDQQVYRALRSRDYHAILKKIADSPYRMSFIKSELAAKLTSSEKAKLNNFLQRMKKLNVLRSGDVRGEYVFNMRMVYLYIWLQSQEKKPTT